MKKWQKMINKIVLMEIIMLSNSSVIFAQSKKYNPYYYPKLREYVDCNQIDFSSEYKKWLIPDNSEKFVDITHELLGNGYVFERASPGRFSTRWKRRLPYLPPKLPNR